MRGCFDVFEENQADPVSLHNRGLREQIYASPKRPGIFTVPEIPL